MNVFSSLLRPKNKHAETRRRQQSGRYRSPPDSPLLARQDRYYSDNPAVYDDTQMQNESDIGRDDALLEDEPSVDDEDDFNEATPLLPIFSSAHLDSLPVYNITHAIRLLIIERCETTLSWDQLRSPQVSQFLVKPIEQRIRASHFSRASLYALIANCLQFNKEGQNNPGNVGVCRTRGLMAELLAVRLLRQFTVRELIDALSYDFNPLTGMSPPPNIQAKYRTSTNIGRDVTFGSGSARTSTLEVAIRAQAKRFLAHPLVVQHLEAIWAGSIVFHSSADSLHRLPSKPQMTHNRHIGATHSAGDAHADDGRDVPHTSNEMIRRSASLYDPRDASLFKLSRLRVPRYRQAFSTLSYTILLGLFVAVLVEKSVHITTLEIVFWFWSVGFMLDELVGFSEQGFGLYIMSVWNSFDLGILLFFFVYYALRLYGLILADEQKHWVAHMAHDTLAATAVLLFPRLFSLLDHYRYFSQLLIAFRLMMQDLAAILILIAITCSGFFVAFTLSFAREFSDGPSVIYTLFQILMGYTPAAWDTWNEYNMLGRILLTLFLIICHFLVVTILITVLTNSFMAIVKNANEEHQFLFAVNVLSMVKSDALFSYIAPSNIVGWVFSPLRYIIPFRQYVRVNRTIIKLTHFPITFLIFAYERLWLSNFVVEPVELVERGSLERGRLATFQRAENQDPFAPSIRVREPSVTTRYKDRALEEVFKRPYKGDTTRTIPGDRPTSTVDSWMNNMGGIASPPPPEQTQSLLDELEVSGPKPHRSMTSLAISSKRRALSRSAVSDNDDGQSRSIRPRRRLGRRMKSRLSADADVTDLVEAREEDLDEESFLIEDEDEDEDVELSATGEEDRGEAVSSLIARKQLESTLDNAKQKTRPTIDPPSQLSMHPFNQLGHNRQASVNTIVFSPIQNNPSSTPLPQESSRPPRTRSRPRTGLPPTASPLLHSGRATPRQRDHIAFQSAGSRPYLPHRNTFQALPAAGNMQMHKSRQREPSYDTVALDLASDIGDNRHIAAGDQSQVYGSSFNVHMDFAAAMRRKERREQLERAEEAQMMSRMVLARMNTLEEGFKDILKEVKDFRNASSRASSEVESGAGEGARRRNRARAPRYEDRKAKQEQVSAGVAPAAPSGPSSSSEHDK